MSKRSFSQEVRQVAATPKFVALFIGLVLASAIALVFQFVIYPENAEYRSFVNIFLPAVWFFGLGTLYARTKKSIAARDLVASENRGS
ncbi:MAG: hypothetical protein L0G87_05500 [Renibacterium salmoninarum]|nr:hypothetical protein [Renibacterium salmoninarum]